MEQARPLSPTISPCRRRRWLAARPRAQQKDAGTLFWIVRKTRKPTGVQQATTFELVINLNIAKALGLLARGAGADDCPLAGDREGLYFRGAAVFAHPEIYDFLTAERIRYTIWLPANSILQRRIGYLPEAPGRATAVRGAPLLPRLQLSSAELEQAAPWPRSNGIRASCTRASASS